MFSSDHLIYYLFSVYWDLCKYNKCGFVCFLDSADWAANFPSCDSYAVSSCAAVRKTYFLVLAVPWRQRSGQAQSKSSQKYSNVKLYLFNLSCF